MTDTNGNETPPGRPFSTSKKTNTASGAPTAKPAPRTRQDATTSNHHERCPARLAHELLKDNP